MVVVFNEVGTFFKAVVDLTKSCSLLIIVDRRLDSHESGEILKLTRKKDDFISKTSTI